MPKSPLPFYVGGEWRGPSSPESTAEIVNPYDGSPVGTVALASNTDLYDAITRAVSGFARTRILQSYERYDILTSIASRLRAQKEELAQLIVSEVGKPITAARAELERSVTTFQYAAEESRRFGGEVVPLDINPAGKNRFGVVQRFPRGVVLAIPPFNFPLNLVAHKVAPALATGNSVILKPAPQAVISSLKLAEVIESSGWPREAFSVLPCSNALAETLVSDEKIKMLSFTGSPAVGWALKAKAAKKKVLVELGGNAGVIVDRSADVDQAVAKNLTGSFVYSGQVCIKVQRIYVHADVFDIYCRKFVEGAKALRCGDPRREETFVGPVINEESLKRILSWIEEARSLGARVLAGGGHNGRVIEPTVLTEVPKSAKVFCAEVFGPVVMLQRFTAIEEAVSGINDSEFGLQAGIFSNDYANILYAYRNLDVGAVVVNENPTFRVDNMPYGGVKNSGFGREGVRYAMEEMTEPKMLVVGT